MTLNKPLKRLRWLSLICITAVLVLLFRSPAIAQTPRHYTDLEFPSLPEITIPNYERYQLDNGIIVYLMEDHNLPLINGTAIIHTGSRLEPPEKVGLAELTGATMRAGGTQQHPPDELNQLLEQRAAQVETGIGTTSGSASFSTLTEDLETVFNLFSEVIRQPAFDPKQLELVKTQQKGAIARRNDDPKDIASRELGKLIYGATSPYARTEEYNTIDNISRDDLIAFHQQYVRPDGIILGIVGDFDPKVMKDLIQQKFGDWKTATPNLKIAVPSAEQKFTQGVFFVNQPQLTQSTVFLGHLGGELNNPDYPALSVLNGVLNGLGGRLVNELRSRQGLAYSVSGVWNPNYDYPGVFYGGGQTRSETTVAFIKSFMEEIDRIRTTPISEQELERAKESILNSFVFKFENPSQTLSRLMTYEYYDYPQDFIFKYQQGVKATTIEDIQRVAQKYLDPNRMVTLVVGNTEQINPPLSGLGKTVTSVDITIPEPKKS
ncbi:peptidase M16 domain protein [Rippkaea orientalis PCC 8801]|uniref:Peptidase M16 domain protein n=1 Tax=Rippkaea orientalis (strain PCC 8801 / RF-1) TaxID=41431 RepID=B7JXI8_RIPO1|nr:pitrilysin family protein [Rippkaea orientalis]ACK64745.1 peptidase M16 domain protein [Rippkaea orientalis PCC 8801]